MPNDTPKITPNEAARRRQWQIEAAINDMIRRRVVSENLRSYEIGQLLGLCAALEEIQNMTLPVNP